MRAASLLIGSALLTGCGPSASAKVEKATIALRSWKSTLWLAEQEEGRGAIPAKFAEQVRRAAEEEQDKARAERRKAAAE
jgi:hypothetical protein